MGSLLEEKRLGPFPDANPLADQLGAFVAACEARVAPLVDAAAATRALRLALEVQTEVAAGLRRLAGAAS
jgi:hypothetical protein